MHFNTGLFFCIISIISYSFYMISLKPSKHRMLTFFWINTISYFGYVTIFFIRKLHFEHDVKALEQLLFTFTFTNVPLYILIACMFVISIAHLNYLMDHFEVSLITPVIEMSILFITLGYIALGNSSSSLVLASVFIIFIGAIISSMETFSFAQPFKDIKKISQKLLASGVLQAFLESSVMLITFLCTHRTTVTEGIIAWLDSVFKNVYDVPFSFHHPFYYTVGVRFFITIIFLLYLLIYQKHRLEILTHPFYNAREIITISAVFLIAIVSYQTAYQNIADKNILIALRKLTIPTILFISYYTLGEKITHPKIIGCSIIVCGGMLTLFA
ncbi:MAG: drug/metabolite transporter (DMT)-like permease [Alteromonas naphthalenivorans]|jgi:drug/metabolite transporter (DMT)-like permease